MQYKHNALHVELFIHIYETNTSDGVRTNMFYYVKGLNDCNSTK